MILSFYCPFDNNITGRQPLVTRALVDNPDVVRPVQCQVCSLQLSVFKDIDPRAGFVMMEVEFGPNINAGELSEREISMYSVFLTDPWGDRVPRIPMLANVTAADKANGTACCDKSAYKARVTLELPGNMTSARLEVVPVIDLGGGELLFMPAGLITEEVHDWKDQAFARASAHRCGRAVFEFACACVFFVQLALWH